MKFIYLCNETNREKREKTRILECSTAAAAKNLSNYTKPFIFANHIEHHLVLGGALEICVFFLSLLKTLSLLCHHENYTEMNLRRAMASSTWDTQVCQKSFINCAIFHWLLSFSLTLQEEPKSSHNRCGNIAILTAAVWVSAAMCFSVEKNCCTNYKSPDSRCSRLSFVSVSPVLVFFPYTSSSSP